MSDDLIGKNESYIEGYAKGLEDGNKWISVKDTLPPEELPILCYLNYETESIKNENKNFEQLKIIVVGRYKKDSCWLISEGDHWQYHKACCTHWMTLPNEPK